MLIFIGFIFLRDLLVWEELGGFNKYDIPDTWSGNIAMLGWLIMANGNGDEVVTRSVLNEAADAILEGMGKSVDELKTDAKSQTESLRSGMEKWFDNLEAGITQMKIELKDEIDGLKADLSTTASGSDLEELKSKLN